MKNKQLLIVSTIIGLVLVVLVGIYQKITIPGVQDYCDLLATTATPCSDEHSPARYGFADEVDNGGAIQSGVVIRNFSIFAVGTFGILKLYSYIQSKRE